MVKGGVRVYEAYEVKNKREKLITLSFTSPEKEFFIYIYDCEAKNKKTLCISLPTCKWGVGFWCLGNRPPAVC
jgi:hypothetical protein